MANLKRSGDLLGEGTDEGKRRKILIIRSITTRSMSSLSRASVIDAVFLTTELLENILRFLPMKDLLLSQRVAHKWRAVISESKKLQQALFFLPQEPGGHWTFATTDNNELLQITKSEYERSQLDCPRGDGNRKSFSKNFASVVLNPLVYSRYKDWNAVDWAKQHDEYSPRSVPVWFNFRTLPSGNHADESWRKMLATQPPIMTIDMHYVYDRARRDYTYGIFTFPTAVTGSDTAYSIEQNESMGRTCTSASLGIRRLLLLTQKESEMRRLTALNFKSG